MHARLGGQRAARTVGHAGHLEGAGRLGERARRRTGASRGLRGRHGRPPAPGAASLEALSEGLRPWQIGASVMWTEGAAASSVRQLQQPSARADGRGAAHVSCVLPPKRARLTLQSRIAFLCRAENPSESLAPTQSRAPYTAGCPAIAPLCGIGPQTTWSGPLTLFCPPNARVSQDAAQGFVFTHRRGPPLSAVRASSCVCCDA